MLAAAADVRDAQTNSGILNGWMAGSEAPSLIKTAAELLVASPKL